MKNRVELSVFSFATTVIVVIILAIGVFTTYGTSNFTTLLIVIALIVLSTLWYCPLSVAIDDKEVCIKSPIHSHCIPLSMIVSAERYYPTRSNMQICICASGGFFGYWGAFRSDDIGNYFAYYGKATDCFLIIANDGSKYVIGCRDVENTVNYVNSKIKS